MAERVSDKARDIAQEFAWYASGHECGGVAPGSCPDCDARAERWGRVIAAAITEAVAQAREEVVRLLVADSTEGAALRLSVGIPLPEEFEARLRAAREEEREACAKLVREWGECENCGTVDTLRDIDLAIRVRGGSRE